MPAAPLVCTQTLVACRIPPISASIPIAPFGSLRLRIVKVRVGASPTAINWVDPPDQPPSQVRARLDPELVVRSIETIRMKDPSSSGSVPAWNSSSFETPSPSASSVALPLEPASARNSSSHRSDSSFSSASMESGFTVATPISSTKSSCTPCTAVAGMHSSTAAATATRASARRAFC